MKKKLKIKWKNLLLFILIIISFLTIIISSINIIIWLIGSFNTKDEVQQIDNIVEVENIKDDKILTLSTCYNNDTERVVLHAKLIKKETR